MNYKTQTAKKPISYKKNPLEKTLDEQTNDSFFDQFFSLNQESQNSSEKLPPNLARERKEQPQPQRKEFTVFADKVHHENHEVPKEIEALTMQVKQAVEQLKKTQKSLDHQIIQVEKHAIESLPQKGGVYHVHFLEKLLSFIKLLQSKVGEAKTWLTAMQTKKKKRGSLFAARSKQKGTQYSLSQELSTARSVQ